MFPQCFDDGGWIQEWAIIAPLISDWAYSCSKHLTINRIHRKRRDGMYYRVPVFNKSLEH